MIKFPSMFCHVKLVSFLELHIACTISITKPDKNNSKSNVENGMLLKQEDTLISSGSWNIKVMYSLEAFPKPNKLARHVWEFNYKFNF